MLDSTINSFINIKYHNEKILLPLAYKLTQLRKSWRIIYIKMKKEAILIVNIFLKINYDQSQKQPVARNIINHKITYAHIAVTTSE